MDKSERDIDLLVVGEINPDLIISHPSFPLRFEQEEILVDGAAMTIGSSNAIFACGAARLGLKVAIIGVVGDDIFGSFMIESLKKRKVDTSSVIVDPSQNTGLSVILNRVTDRAILSYLGTMNALRAEQITDEMLSKSRHLHIASYFIQTNLQPGLPNLFRRAHQLGLTTSLDTNWDPAEEWSGVHELLPLTDIFLPNKKEAMSLTGKRDPKSAARVLAAYGGTVAIKMGSKGALACKMDKCLSVPSLSVKVSDTVGAGDSFNAGLIYGFLHRWSLERMLQLAVACGSLSTQAVGGTNGQPSLEEALSKAGMVNDN
jgi:sugar/nucleoside kinase (ribokinase family)